MRTRFLNVDFFCPSPNQTLHNISVFHLPIPHLPPPILPFDTEISSFHLVSCISPEIDPFPFENALSQFLSIILPSNCSELHAIRSPDEQKRRNSRSNAASVEIPEEQNVAEKEKEICRNSNFESPDVEFFEKENELSSGENNGRWKEVRFEIPEVDFSQEESFCSYEGKNGEIHFDIPDLTIPLNILEVGDIIPYPSEISRSVYSVEDVISEHHKAQSSYVVDCSSAQEMALPYPSKLMNLEINEIGLEIYNFPSVEKEFHSLISNIGQRHWAEKDNLMVDCKELLVSMDIDMLECLSGEGPSMQYPKPQPTSLYSLMEMEFLTPVADSLSMESMIHYHEVEILDFASFESLQAFGSSQVGNESETMEQMLKEDIKSAGSFYESIVNAELALMDDTFISLPIPILGSDKEIISLSVIFKDILDESQMCPASACDEIYLDWHLLQDNTCTRSICSAYRDLFNDVDTYGTASEVRPTNERLVIDLVLFDDCPEELNTSYCREILSKLAADTLVTEPLPKCTTNNLLKNEIQKSENEKPALTLSPEKISLLLESMSQFNDLNFFLKARKVAAVGNSKVAMQEKADGKVLLPDVSARDTVELCSSLKMKFQQWDIEVHEVKLSDHMLSLIDNIQKSYFTILENDTDLKKKHYLFQPVDNFNWLSFPKEKLMDLITKTNAQRNTMASEDEPVMGYVALYAIKQMVFYFCFYGIHSTHLYASNLSQNIKYIKSKLSPLLSLIEDAFLKAEKGITESHPSLSVVEEILQSNTSQEGRKVLIVAHTVFWWPLIKKLTSMSISFHEVSNGPSFFNHLGALDADGYVKFILGSLLKTDCILISHEHVCPSFPFNKFSIILEYGGPCSSSRISAISSELAGLPPIQFLRVKLEESSVPKVLCEGFDASQHLLFSMEGVSISMPGQQEISTNVLLVQLLNFIPTVEKDSDMASQGIGDGLQAFQVPDMMARMPTSVKSHDTNSSMPSFPDIVIVVNTHNSEKEMLISQRSSYQKILAMEKGGVQVVEREINLPVDLIFSAATCLIWYNARNLGIDKTSAGKPSSCIPDCIENIATNIFMSLSPSFSCCVMVFEGDRSFLTAIMEASDGLYVAAASLDIHLQLFCSYSSESTDEIILDCIKYATKLNRGLYPAMLESETLAESFLMRFPSINPLTAHAVLSSGGMLVEFLEWSQEQRILATRKYHVPEESIALFSALCKYGELGESKSGITDCSSSLSSAFDSDYSSSKIQSQRKKQNYYMDTLPLHISRDESLRFEPLSRSKNGSLQFEPLNRPKDGSPEPYKAFWPYQLRIFSNCTEGLEKSEGRKLSPRDETLDLKQVADTFFMDNLDWKDIDNYRSFDEDIRGNVIKDNELFLDTDFSSVVNKRSFPNGAPQVPMEAPVEKSIGSTRRLFGTSNYAAIPTAEISCNLDAWFSLKDHNQRLKDNDCGELDIETCREGSVMKCQEELLDESRMQKSTRTALGLSSQQNVTPPYGKMVLSNATSSSRLQQGPPWKIEFLNRIKEKNKRNQQSLPCNACMDCFGGSRKKDKFVKTKSPSSIDSYRYQGSSQLRKTIPQMWKKQFRPSQSPTGEKKVLSFDPTWTPIEKRARQSLSFMTNGNEKQSKLVWSDRNVHSLRKRYRDEA